MRRLIGIGLMMVIGAAVLSMPVWAQSQEVAATQPAADAAACEWKAGKCDKAAGCEWRAKCGTMMKQKLEAGAPDALLMAAEKLGLSDDQTAQLEAIRDEAQAKAKAVLTPQQTEQLTQLLASPEGMCQVQGQMCPVKKKDCQPGCTKPCCAKDKKRCCDKKDGADTAEPAEAPAAEPTVE